VEKVGFAGVIREVCRGSIHTGSYENPVRVVDIIVIELPSAIKFHE